MIAAGCLWAVFALRGDAPCTGLDCFFLSDFRFTRVEEDVLIRSRAWFGDVVWSFLHVPERDRLGHARRIDHLFSLDRLGDERAVTLIVID